MFRRIFLAAALALTMLGGTPALAATQAAYTPQALTAAQTAGKPILIAVHAPWCPVCTKQDPIVKSLTAAPEFKDMVILTVDFDSQKDVLKTLNVQKQSTLIVMRGAAEKDRSTGVSDEAAIKALLMKALS